jgi:selenocysteine-specific elongation factor
MVQEIEISPTRTLRIHGVWFAELCDRLVAVLDKLHDQHPLRSELDRNLVLSRFAYLGKEALVSAVLAALERAGRIRLSARGVALVGRGPQLSAGERQVLQWLIERFRESGYQPPTPDECRRDAPKNSQSVPQLLALAVADGHLVEIAADFYLHAEVERQLRDKLREMLAGGAGVTLSQIREGLGTTRKYAVPICEYLDRVGFTRRDGDLRFLGNPSE